MPHPVKVTVWDPGFDADKKNIGGEVPDIFGIIPHLSSAFTRRIFSRRLDNALIVDKTAPYNATIAVMMVGQSVLAIYFTLDSRLLSLMACCQHDRLSELCGGYFEV